MHWRVLCLAAALLAANAPVDAQRSVPSAPSPAPAYRWRGVSIDVARRFFAPAEIRRLIDLEAHYDLNVLHLHLTDNEAWRLPSDRYPRLPSAQHYTRSDLTNLDAYAARHGVTIVPEIDIPAHAAAAIDAYPQLACGSDDTLCPQRAAAFATDVVSEAMQFFHGAYMHVGGDEVEGWTQAQRAAFERALDGVIRRNGKTMVAWDDETDAAPADVVVEVWHLGNAAARAMRSGHRIVAAADGPLYFDAVQGAANQEPRGTRYMSTLEEVYSYSVPPRALGVEGVVWSSYIYDASQLWYALLPRTIALSAIAKQGERKPPWPAFRDRTLPNELAWLLDHHYTFRVPNTIASLQDPQARYASVAGDQNASVAYTRASQVDVALHSIVPGASIRYRLADGAAWERYVAPFPVSAAEGMQVQAQTVVPNGRAGAITTLLVRRAPSPRGSLHFDDVVSP